MSSAINEVITLIETAVSETVPSALRARNYYDFNKNDGVQNDWIYAVRPGSGSPVSGTIRHVTMEQDFELELSKDFIEKDATDITIRAAIEQIYSANEAIIKAISLRRSGSILKIGEPSFDSPEINQTQKSVSIVFTYPVTYKKQITGES